MSNVKTNIKIASRDSCTGCAACANVCPKSCIKMEVNADGFLQPKIDAKLCIGCHKCEKTCPIINREQVLNDYKTKVYAAIIKDEKIRSMSSSGGAFYGLSNWVIDKGGVVFGAKFNGIHLQHDFTDNLDGLYPFMGSKYIQSDIADSFFKVKTFLQQDRFVLYSGTPCQIAGLKRYLQKDYEKLITVDLLCHGVPSPTIWERYIKRQMKKLGARDIRDIRFRTKRDDVISSINFYFFFFFLGADGLWHEFGEDCHKNLYFAYFMRHLFRSSCYNCPFRDLETSNADFTIGDCWNVDKDHPKMSDNKGISTIILHTQKAERIISELKDKFILEDEDVSIMVNRFLEAKQEERTERNCRLWKLSNKMAQFVPLEYVQSIYMHDRLDYVLKRKLYKLWQRSTK